MQNYWFTRREIRETKRKAYSIHNSNSQIRYWRNIDITSLILYRFHLQAFYKTYCTIFLPYSFYEIFHLRERERESYAVSRNTIATKRDEGTSWKEHYFRDKCNKANSNNNIYDSTTPWTYRVVCNLSYESRRPTTVMSSS